MSWGDLGQALEKRSDLKRREQDRCDAMAILRANLLVEGFGFCRELHIRRLYRLLRHLGTGGVVSF
jgi:hypothetical protein